MPWQELLTALQDAKAQGRTLSMDEFLARVVVCGLEQERQIAELQKNLVSLTGTVSDHTTFHPESGTYHGMDE